MAAQQQTAKKNTRKRSAKRVDRGQVHIHASFNNTIVTVTDLDGGVLSWSSAGKLGLKGSRKSTPFAAQMVAEDAAKIAKDSTGLRSVEVFVKGAGSGRESAIRALGVVGLEVTLIKDVSPIAHNGCRAPKRRRL